MGRTAGFFIKGSLSERIYKYIIKQRAVTTQEIYDNFKQEIKKNHIPSYLKQILNNGHIVKSKKRTQSTKRKCSGGYVYGIDEESINQKMYSLSKKIDQKELLDGIKRSMHDFISKTDTGYTTSEILYELIDQGIYSNTEGYDYIYTCLRDLQKLGLIVRSQFKIPGNCMINGRKPGYVYARDNKAIWKKVLEMMPIAVRDAVQMIMQSDDLHTIDTMEERFKVTYEEIKAWFDKRLCNVGSISVYSYKMRRYYHNPNLTEKYVENEAKKMHETQITKSILNGMSMGRAFECQALYYFVMYLIIKNGLQIRLNNDFPQKIPSWFNPGDIKKYTIGEGKDKKYLVDVWKFDSEPIDYLVFCYDEILKTPVMGYAISMKRDYKSRMIGNAGKKYIAMLVGCLSKGITLDLKNIPVTNSLNPVIIMNNPNGIKLFQWAQKTGCMLLYGKRMEEIMRYVNEHGFVYDKDNELKQLKEYHELFQQYKDHKDVVLGKIQVEDLVKLKVNNKVRVDKNAS